MTSHHRHHSPRKPEGQATRGKTARNRLRRVDSFLLVYDPELLKRTDGRYERAFFVDLGFGEKPVTTLESARRLRRIFPALPVLGVEIDWARANAAQAYADERTFFRVGGFNLPLGTWPDGTPETVRLIRAFNVLRQYAERDVPPAYDRLLQYILPGGLLFEGTSDPLGSIWVANVARKLSDAAHSWEIEALVFGTSFRTGFDPSQFQAVLPKNHIHRVVPGEPLFDFFRAWKQAARETSPMQVWGHRQWFMSSAFKLAEQGFRLNLRKKWLRRGWLVWARTAASEERLE
jgi:hypothetical protein